MIWIFEILLTCSIQGAQPLSFSSKTLVSKLMIAETDCIPFLHMQLETDYEFFRRPLVKGSYVNREPAQESSASSI